MTMNRRLLITAVLAAVWLVLPAGAASRSPAVGPAGLTLKPAVGPPTTKTKATGTGYLAGETVVLSFDGARLAHVVADQTGAFSKRIVVPASALAGHHTVAATGRSSGLAATAPFLVRTDWLQACFDGGR